MADNNGLPEGAAVGPDLQKTTSQTEGLPEGAVVGPSLQPSASSTESKERYALIHPEAGLLPKASRSSYEVRPVVPSGERAGAAQAGSEKQTYFPSLEGASRTQTEKPTAGKLWEAENTPLLPEGKTERTAKEYAQEQLKQGHPYRAAAGQTLADIGATTRQLITSPLAIETLGAGPVLEEGTGLLRYGSKLLPLAFGARGGQEAYEGAKDIREKGLTPENISKTGQGLGQMMLGGAATAEGTEFGNRPAGEALTAPVRAGSRALKSVAPALPTTLGMAAGEVVGHPYYGAIAGRVLLPKEWIEAVLDKGTTVGLSKPEANAVRLEGIAKDLERKAAEAQEDVDMHAASGNYGVKPPEEYIKVNKRAQDKASEARFHADAAREAMEKSKAERNAPAPAPAPAEVPTEKVEAAPLTNLGAKPPEVKPAGIPKINLPEEKPLEPPKLATNAEKAPEYAGEERRVTPRTAPMSPAEIEEAIKNRKPVRTPFDETEGAMKTIQRDEMMPKTPVEEAAAKPALPAEEPAGYTAKKEEVVPVGEEGREPAKSAAEYHPAVQQKVGELSDENLRKLAKAHGLNPDEYDFNARDERRHRIERDQLTREITEQMGEDEKINLGRAAEATEKEGIFAGADVSAKGKAARAAKMFPRLRGPVDEFGNPKASGGSQAALPTGDQLIKKYGESSGDPKDVTFILKDGRAVANTGIEHDQMLGGKTTDKVPPREKFISEGNIRVRPRMGAGREVSLSIPESGINAKQLDYLKKMAPQLKSGAVMIEIGKPGGDYRILSHGEATPEALEKTLKELAPVEESKEAPAKEPAKFNAEQFRTQTSGSLEPLGKKKSPFGKIR